MLTGAECCMSGCVHCVYNIYADDLEAYTEALESAHTALKASGKPTAEWPEAVRKLDNTSGGKEGMVEQEKEKVGQGLDPVMSAFLAMENKLKKKQVSIKGSTA